MGRAYFFELRCILREREEMFWSLAFPLVLATLFYLAFGQSGGTVAMTPVPAAVVGTENAAFHSFLDSLDGEMLALERMDEAQAKQALADGEKEGIFFCKAEPSLLVAGSQLEESILTVLLQEYLEYQTALEEIVREHPLRLPAALRKISEAESFILFTDLTGNQVDQSLNYFWALIGMAAMFGSFIGLSRAKALCADCSALAARRAAAPVPQGRMMLAGALAAFTIQFFHCCLLLLYLHFAFQISLGPHWPLLLPVCAFGSIAGVSLGCFVGSLRLRENMKVGLLISVSLLLSCLAGLTYGNMKDLVERYFPLLNRINPAALISDAIYSVSVYGDRQRYTGDLVLLAVIAAGILAAAAFRLGRERYDSI